MHSIVMLLLLLLLTTGFVATDAYANWSVRIGSFEEWRKEPNMATDQDLWIVTWREWEPDPAQHGWVYAINCDTPGCATPKHWGYHTRFFATQALAVQFLNEGYSGDVANVVSLRRAVLEPLARKVVGNKTVERTVVVQESVADEQWVEVKEPPQTK